MASVRKREWTSPAGEKKTAWVVAYTDQVGKRRLKTYPLKKVADAERLRIEVEIEKGVHVAASGTVTVSKALDLWFIRCEERVAAQDHLRPGTLRHWRCECEGHLRPLLGHKKLTELNYRVIQNWIDQLAYERKLAKNTVAHIFMCLRLLLKHAYAQGLIGHNPAIGSDFRIPGHVAPKTPIPTKAEIRQYLQFFDRPKEEVGWCAKWFRPMVYAAIFSGLRQGELRALRWEHVDFEANTIRVSQSADQKGYIAPPKSRAGTREVPLAPPLKLELMQWRMANGRPTEGFVFISRTGQMVDASNVFYAWSRMLYKLENNVPGNSIAHVPAGKYRWHSLRHVAASLFIESGLPPKRIQAIMGHSSISMTFDTYGNLFDDAGQIEKAMSRLGADLL